jgi:hypothetical protein
MKVIFADTSYFLALFNPNDAHHERAVSFSKSNTARLLLTSAIVLELGARCCRRYERAVFFTVLDILERYAEILHVDEELQNRGIKLFMERRDKDWSLADCISFLVMEDRQIREAATSDKHFEEANFVALLRHPLDGQ